MRKKIINKTILFVSIVMFVSIFKSIFGEENTLVGVSAVIASLVLLEKNLTQKPLISFLELLGVNLAIGILSHIANMNMWLGLIINFSSLSLIGYIFSYSMSKRLIIPFGLQYLFILYAPVDSSDLGTRLIALTVSSIIVMIIQFIMNSKRKDSPEMTESLLFSIGEDENDEIPMKIFNKTFNLHPIRASYALRVGLLTAVSGLIVSSLGLEQGKWIVFTVFSITEFYAEHCKVKSRDRVHGTLVGAFIVIVLFTIIKDNTLRTLIVLMAGYLNPFADNYKDATICVTVSAVASVALTNGALSTVLERVIYVLIGVGISILANKYIIKAPKESDFKEALE